MADNRGLRYAGKEPETLSEDDPLAELARIAGEFAPPQARAADEGAKPSSDEAFEFDLEAELLRSFGVDQPAATADADNDEPADLPAFLRSRPPSEEMADAPANVAAAPAAYEFEAEAEQGLPDPEPVAATGGGVRTPEILEEWTDLPAWPAHRPNTAARGREDAPDPSLGTIATDRSAAAAPADEPEAIAEDFSVVESSAEAPEEASAAAEDEDQADMRLADEEAGTPEYSEPVESAAEEIPEDERLPYAEELPADQPVGQDAEASADDAAAAEEEFVAQELDIAGEPAEDYPEEGRAAPVPQAGEEEWDAQTSDEEPTSEAEPFVAESEQPHAPVAIEDDPVWQDFERYAVPERAEQAPEPAEAAAEPQPDNQWDIADELERAFAQFDGFRAAPAAMAAPALAAESRGEVPEAAWNHPKEPAQAEIAPPAAEAIEPVPAEIETFEPELEIETLPEEPAAAVAPVEEDGFDIDFDFDDLELEMQAAAEDDLLRPEPFEAVAEVEATSEETYETAPEPTAFEPVVQSEAEFEPSYEEGAWEAAEPIPTIDLDWPPVVDVPSEAAPAVPVAAAAPTRDDLIFDIHDVADTTAMVEPVGEIDIPELPVDDDPAARETVDPDLSDLEAEFAEILAAEPAAPADEAPLEAELPEPEKPLSNGHDKAAVAAIDFAQYDFADLGRRQPEFGTPSEPQVASDTVYDAGDEDIYFDDIGHGDARAATGMAPKRKWIIAGGAGVLLCGVALATFFLTGGDVVGSGEPPVIAASDEPFKIVPEDRGGRAVPNQDQAVYQQVAGAESADAANLVSRSEQPVDVVQRTLDPQVLPLEGRPDPDTLAMVAPGEESVEAPEAAAAEPAEDAAMTEELLRGATEPSAEVAPERFGLEPRRVETLVVRADGTLVPAASVEQEPAAAAPATAAEAPTPSERPEGAAPSDPEARLQPAGEADDISAPVRSVQTTTLTPGASPTTGEPAEGEGVEQAALAEPTTSAGLVGQGALNNPGGYVMQIASQPSEEGARETYENLLAQYGSILGGRQAQIQAADIPDRGTFYRVRVAGGSREEAVALCEQYQAAGGSCFVAR